MGARSIPQIPGEALGTKMPCLREVLRGAFWHVSYAVAWARSHDLLLPVIAAPVAWSLGPAGMILERFTYRGHRALAKFVEVATANTETGRHV
jgi:hypothetical protein